MAPGGSRVRAERPFEDAPDVGIPEKKRRVHHDVIEGIEIFSFEDELELEYFSNIEEPLPRKIHQFRGFGGKDSSVDVIKNSFDQFVGKLIAGESMPRRDSPARVEDAADEALIILSDDENSSKVTDVRRKVATPEPVDSEDEPVQIVNEPPPDVITIDSDSDDDVIMVSDPKAPVPQPVKDCLCPNCGKVRRTEPSRKPVSETDKDSGIDDVSVITDEVTIIIDEDGPMGEAPGRARNGGPPEEISAQPAEVQTEHVPARPVEVQTEVHLEAAEAQTEEVHSQPAEAQTEELPAQAAKERGSPLKVHGVFSSVEQPNPVPSSSLPKPISPKSQKPSPIKIPAAVPQSVRLVSKESGKTLILKVDGAKSKILSPSIKNSLIRLAPANSCNSGNHPQSTHYIAEGKSCGASSSEAKASKKIGTVTTKEPPTTASTKESPPRSVVSARTAEVGKAHQSNDLPRTYRVTIPPNTIRVTVPPGFLDKNEVPGVQQGNGAKRRVQFGNLGIAKSGVVAVSNPQQKGPIILSHQSQMKQQGSQAVADAACGSSHAKSPQAKSADASVVNSGKANTADASVVDSRKAKTADASLVNSPKAKTAHASVVNSRNLKTADASPVNSRSVKTADASLVSSGKAKTADASLVNSRKVKAADASLVNSRSVKTADASVVNSRKVKTADASLVNSRSVKTADASVVNSRKVKTADDSLANSLKESHLACGSSGLQLVSLKRVTESAPVEPPAAESPIAEPGFELVRVEDDTKSVVRDLVDFVCRQEHLPSIYPYDEERRELFCFDVTCRKLTCRLGCVCNSLAKKNVRRVRCRNANCIFGCSCMPQSVALPANRHAKTVPNMKILSVSRRKQVLTVLPDCDADGSGFGAQPAVKSLLPVQKLPGVHKTVSGRRGSTSNGGVHGGFGSSSVPASKGLLPAEKAPVPKNGVSTSQRSRGPSERVVLPKEVPAAQPTVGGPGPRQGSANSLPVPVTQPKRFFGREKIPIPERALVCLTPGLGYVPLEEITPKVTVRNPFKPGTTKSFLTVRQATEWLDSTLHAILNTSTDLRWVVADKTTIEKKQLHRLSIDLLKSPNCTISRTGAVFTSL